MKLFYVIRSEHKVTGAVSFVVGGKFSEAVRYLGDLDSQCTLQEHTLWETPTLTFSDIAQHPDAKKIL